MIPRKLIPDRYINIPAFHSFFFFFVTRFEFISILCSYTISNIISKDIRLLNLTALRGQKAYDPDETLSGPLNLKDD